MQCIYHILLCIDVDISKETERPQIIKSCHVVVVYVGEQYGIKPLQWIPYDLLTKIGATVYQYPKSPVGFDHCTRSETLVFRLAAPTYGTLASQCRDANACACTKKSEFHFSQSVVTAEGL